MTLTNDQADIIATDSVTTVKTTCAYCGVGCGVLATVDPVSNTVAVKGDPDHPANFGKLCSKGSALGDTLDTDRRLANPSIHGNVVSWDEATGYIANHFTRIIEEHGSDSVMLYVSGQLLTEDYYVANKFAKGFLGTNNIDSNSRLCMSSAVAGYKRAFGTDTVPCSYTDIEESDVFIIVGSNMAWCHPILFGRLKASKQHNPHKKVVVIDPRATDSTQIADLHLPLASGTDTHLFNGLLRYLYHEGFANADYLAHCDSLDETLIACEPFTVDHVANVCKVDKALVLAFYQLFASTKKAVSFYSMGVNQSTSGTDKVNSIINCHLYTGKLGYPGAGTFSITGQPNAMGGREVGALANLLANHFDLNNELHRQQVAQFWQAPKVISDRDGIKAPHVADAISSGKIKAIWIMATNPVVSLPEADEFAKALSQCELVIVSDCSNDSDTLRYAHVALPAQGWSEKSGTVTNSERRISRQRRLLAPYGQAKPDWWIISAVAKKMGFTGFDYRHERDVFVEHVRLSGFENHQQRSFDISELLGADNQSTMSEHAYDALLPFQWGKRHYFSQSDLQQQHTYTASRKLAFVPITPRLPQSSVSRRFPFILNTGRLRDQWHTMTRTAIAPQLNQHLPEPFIAMHPQDAESLGIQDNDFVSVTSKHHQLIMRTQLSHQQRRGDVFSPMHWNDHFANNARVGTLISANIDPVSQQPEFKNTPVAIRPYPLTLFAKLFIVKHADETVLHWLHHRNVTTPLYWVRNRQQHSTTYLWANHQSLDSTCDETSWLQLAFWKQTLLRLLYGNNYRHEKPLDVIHYVDSTNNDVRIALLDGDHLLAAAFIHPDEAKLPGHAWLDSLFEQPLESIHRKWLLAGRAASGFVDVGRIVCSCMTVGENTILNTIKEQQCLTVEEVGNHCKAGTNCGSCVSEIKHLLARASG